jgi:TatD DNase family protein
MIDTHCHIQVAEYDADRDALLLQAAANGVEAIVVPAIDEKSFHDTLAVTTHPALSVYCGIGVHPHHASEVTSATLARVEELVRRDRVVAVGEIGLDYHYDFAPRDVQQHVFREQLRIAKRTQRPAIVHNRESDDDILRIINEEQDGTLRGVFHCFSSTPEMLARALDTGFHVSFTANITFKSSTLSDVVRSAPLDRIMIETDSPWMSPPPFRGKRNCPDRVRLVAEKIAALKGIDVNEVARMTTATARRFFALALLLIVCSASVVLAQTKPTQTVPDTTRKDSTREAVRVKEMVRTFGIGGGIGSSAVQLSEGGTGESNLFCTMFQVLWMPWRATGFELRYYGFTDDKYGDRVRWKDTIKYEPDPTKYDKYRAFDLAMRFLFNPRNPIGISGFLGISYMKITQSSTVTNASVLGLVLGLHVALDIDTGFGVIAPYGEYRVVKEIGFLGGEHGAVRGNDIVPLTSGGLMYYFPEGFKY